MAATDYRLWSGWYTEALADVSTVTNGSRSVGYNTHATGVDPFRRQASPREVPIATRATPPGKRARRWT
jgi:hypothetical protein